MWHGFFSIINNKEQILVITKNQLKIMFAFKSNFDEILKDHPFWGELDKIKLIKNDLSVVIESEDNQWTPPLNKRFGLPDDFDRKNIKAKVEKGILYVTILAKKDLENDIEIL